MSSANTLGYIEQPGVFKHLETSFIDLHNGANPAHKEGRVFYDAAEHTLSCYNDFADTTLQIGYETWARVYNSGPALANGTPVYVFGQSNNLPDIRAALANTILTVRVCGVVTHAIPSNSEGLICVRGIVHDVDTAGYTPGDSLYVHPTIAGALTSVAPRYPYFAFVVATVAIAAATNGSLLVESRPTVDFSTFGMCRLYSTQTQLCTTTNIPKALTFNQHEHFGVDIIDVDTNANSPNIQFLETGIFQLVFRYQVHRTNSAAVAKLQFYLRQGTVLPLTRANDLANTNININIDANTDRQSMTAATLITASAGDYLNTVMIGSYAGGDIGVEATTGIVETGGFATPGARSVTVLVTKIR